MLRRDLDQSGKDTSEASLLQAWQELRESGQETEVASQAITSWTLSGHGWGSSTLLRLRPTDLDAGWSIYLLLRKPPHGHYGVGFSIMTDAYVDKHALIDDDHGSDMIDHIASSSNSGPSSFFTNSGAIRAKNGPVSVSVTAGRMAIFTISDA
jgi:hypothetical protein